MRQTPKKKARGARMALLGSRPEGFFLLGLAGWGFQMLSRRPLLQRALRHFPAVWCSALGYYWSMWVYCITPVAGFHVDFESMISPEPTSLIRQPYAATLLSREYPQTC